MSFLYGELILGIIQTAVNEGFTVFMSYGNVKT